MINKDLNVNKSSSRKLYYTAIDDWDRIDVYVRNVNKIWPNNSISFYILKNLIIKKNNDTK